MADRTNQQWLAELRGPERQSALADLRALLLRGLRYALMDRYGVSEAHLEDFVQEALLKILDGLDTFRGESHFITWANKIAVRVAFSELRRKRWEDVSLQDLLAPYGEDFTPAFLTDPDPSPEKRVTQEALLALVQRTIKQDLTARQRQAITAVMVGGMSLEEVARRMDTNRNALYKLIHDARQRLQRALLAQGLSPEEILAAFE